MDCLQVGDRLKFNHTVSILLNQAKISVRKRYLNRKP